MPVLLLLASLSLAVDKPKPPLELEPSAAAELVKAKTAVIYDVREQEERTEVIPGSKWLPMSLIEDASMWERFKRGIPKGKTIIFHCRAGRRAKRAADKLSADGYRAAFFDGPEQWKKAGLSLDKGPVAAK
jgi:rhodanese-related sulfurtransferase